MPSQSGELVSRYTSQACATDCVAAGSCVITPDDGRGHSEIAIVASQVQLVFPVKTSVPESISVIWAKGK